MLFFCRWCGYEFFFYSTSILDIRTHFKPTETFQYTHFTSCHPIRGQEGLYKRRSPPVTQNKFLKRKLSKPTRRIPEAPQRERGYPRNLITLTLSEIHFENRKEALRQKPSREKTILPFVTQYQPSVPSLKNILMIHWQLIEKQPLLRQIYKEPPIISYKRGRSLKCQRQRNKIQRQRLQVSDNELEFSDNEFKIATTNLSLATTNLNLATTNSRQRQRI